MKIMTKQAGPQRGAYLGGLERRIWTYIGRIAIGIILLAFVIGVAFLFMFFGGHSMSAARLHAGPPVKNVTYDGDSIALVLPNEYNGESLRLLAIQAQPVDSCTQFRRSAATIETMDHFTYGGQSYPIVAEWIGMSQAPISSHGVSGGELFYIGSPGVSYRAAFRTPSVEESIAIHLRDSKCSMVVFTGPDQTFIAPIERKSHARQIRERDPAVP